MRPSGNWRLTADAAGNPLDRDAQVDFAFLAGDFAGDVDLADVGLLRANFGATL